MRVDCKHVTDDPLIDGGFIEPYYQFAYYVEDDYIDFGQLTYAIEINAFSGVIKSVSGPGEGQG